MMELIKKKPAEVILLPKNYRRSFLKSVEPDVLIPGVTASAPPSAAAKPLRQMQ